MYSLEIDCGVPQAGVHTETPLDAPILFGQTFTYSCVPGYATTDDLTVSCTHDGQFSATPPECYGNMLTQSLMGCMPVALMW